MPFRESRPHSLFMLIICAEPHRKSSEGRMSGSQFYERRQQLQSHCCSHIKFSVKLCENRPLVTADLRLACKEANGAVALQVFDPLPVQLCGKASYTNASRHDTVIIGIVKKAKQPTGMPSHAGTTTGFTCTEALPASMFHLASEVCSRISRSKIRLSNGSASTDFTRQQQQLP